MRREMSAKETSHDCSGTATERTGPSGAELARRQAILVDRVEKTRRQCHRFLLASGGGLDNPRRC